MMKVKAHYKRIRRGESPREWEEVLEIGWITRNPFHHFAYNKEGLLGVIDVEYNRWTHVESDNDMRLEVKLSPITGGYLQSLVIPYSVSFFNLTPERIRSYSIQYHVDTLLFQATKEQAETAFSNMYKWFEGGEDLRQIMLREASSRGIPEEYVNKLFNSEGKADYC